MKLKQVFAWMCILLVSVNAYAVEIQTTTTTKKISPATLAQLKAGTSPSTTYTSTLPLKRPIQPATGTTEEPPVVAPEGHVEQIPPDRSTGEPICPDGYYCKAVLGGTSVYCQRGSGETHCNSVAEACQIYQKTGLVGIGALDPDKYCKR